jgi:tRNA (mo5U34)-methyltransferase
VNASRLEQPLHAQIEALAPWFHNLHLPGGVQTAPGHQFGDFPAFKWDKVAHSLPQDLSGWTALDIGCNAGFYTFELARRGAQVLGIDIEEHYLKQAEWAARLYGLSDRVSFQLGHVYELAKLQRKFDFVWFTGVFYHLRYPMLALDLVRSVTGKLMMFQTMTMPGDHVVDAPEDMTLDERPLMLEAGWPKMAFIEHKLANDSSNWWAPNHACVEAMLRSAGYRVLSRPEHEFYFCEPTGAEFQTELDICRSTVAQHSPSIQRWQV